MNTCVIPDCAEPAHRRWLCSLHYQRLRMLPEVEPDWPTLEDGEPLPADIEMLELGWLQRRAKQIATRSARVRRKYTARERKLVQSMRDAGMTCEQIAQSIDRSAPSVWQVLSDSGYRRRNREHTRQMGDAIVIAAIAHRNETGESWEMCREAVGFECSPNALRKRCVDYARRGGISLRMGKPTTTRRS